MMVKEYTQFNDLIWFTYHYLKNVIFFLATIIILMSFKVIFYR